MYACKYFNIKHRYRWLCIMAAIIIKEVICLIKSHFGCVSNDIKKTAVSAFYTNDELTKANAIIHVACVKYLPEGSVPHIIARKGDSKKMADAEEIMAFFKLLCEIE